MRIRNITSFIPVGWPLDTGTIASAARLLNDAKGRLVDAGFEVQSTSLATPPFLDVLGHPDPDLLLEYAQTLEATAQNFKIDAVSIGPVHATTPLALLMSIHALPRAIQGTSIVSHISAERQEASKDFIRWFAQEDVQAEWARLGGYTCNENVLKTQEFLDATPFNAAFAETMGFVVDFWNIPIYDPMLRDATVALGEFVIEGQGTAEETMTGIAENHDEMLREGGYIE